MSLGTAGPPPPGVSLSEDLCADLRQATVWSLSDKTQLQLVTRGVNTVGVGVLLTSTLENAILGARLGIRAEG